MFAGFADTLTENLGIKEGLAEFRGQLRRDTRAIAEEKGVDLSKLDALEEKVALKHEELRSAALTALTKDDTLAQLLDLKQSRTDAAVEEAQPHDLPDGGGGNGGAAGSSPPRVGAPAAAAPPECPRGQAPLGTPTQPLGGSGSGTRPLGEGGPARPEEPARVSARGAPRTSSLEEELRQQRAAAEALEAELREAKVHLQLLEARCGELSGISDDALSRAETLQRESNSWRLQAEQQERQLKVANEEKEESAKALRDVQRRLEELAATPRRSTSPDSRAEGLADEVAYLRKSLDVKEQKLKEVTEERRLLEQKSAAGRATARDPEHGLMLDAHTAIAAAFGDVLSGPPLLRCIDEPLLRLTALLLRQPFIRRVFYTSSAFLWVFALHHIVVAPHT